MTTENDWLNAIDFAKEKAEAKGLAEGRAEGKAEGLAEGFAQQSRAIAKMMKEKQLPIQTISECTGLSEDEIAEL